jgi:hypothetical protein
LPDFVQEKVDEEFKFYSGIGEIEELARSAEKSGEAAKLQLPMGSDIARIMNAQTEHGHQIISIYWAISPVSLRGIGDRIRTNLVQLVAELRASMPEDGVLPTAEAASNALQVVVTGKRAKVNINNAQTSGPGNANVAVNTSQDESGFWTTSRRIAAVIVGIATVAGAVFAGIQVL